MPDRSGLTVSFLTPLFFRYHLRLRYRKRRAASIASMESYYFAFFLPLLCQSLKKIRYLDRFRNIFEINLSFLVNYCYNPPILQLQENIDL